MKGQEGYERGQAEMRSFCWSTRKYCQTAYKRIWSLLRADACCYATHHAHIGLIMSHFVLSLLFPWGLRCLLHLQRHHSTARGFRAASICSDGPSVQQSPWLQSNGTASPAKAKPQASTKQASDTHTLDFQEKFYARPQAIFECFTQAPKIQAFTQSPAQAQPEVGGSFSMFGGSVQGVYLELVPFSKLKLDWRFGNWPDDATSQVWYFDTRSPYHKHD